MTIKKRMIILAILSAATLCFAAAQKITDLGAIAVEPADDDLFLVYDMSIPMTAAIEYADLEGSIEYEKIDGYVANAHVDWTVDHGAYPDINIANVPNFAASVLTSGYLSLDVGGTGKDASAWTGILGVTFPPPLGPEEMQEVDTKAELEDMLDDVADFGEADGDTYTGVHNFTSATFSAIMHMALVSAESDDCTLNSSCDFNAAKTVHVYTLNGANYIYNIADASVAGTLHTITVGMVAGGESLLVTPLHMVGGTSITLNADGESVSIEFDGTNWFVADKHEATVNP